MRDDTILVENVNHPGRTSPVNRVKYEAIRGALMAILPAAEPGLSQAEMTAAVKPHLPDELFPGGQTAGWWVKAVQLDLEAKGVLARHGKPLRWRRV
ncbi:MULTISPECIES: hypothetical protein [unclassified Phenylobacterium]|uniref:DUF6958 family protein n=1 Tax=unclassified Phenylobacterium TaxID=2640670 RepID=UPI000839E9DD|nr:MULTISPECIES: hypothetical protein [unclassified Phenylobacterium]